MVGFLLYVRQVDRLGGPVPVAPALRELFVQFPPDIYILLREFGELLRPLGMRLFEHLEARFEARELLQGELRRLRVELERILAGLLQRRMVAEGRPGPGGAGDLLV